MKAYYINPNTRTVEAIEYGATYDEQRTLITGGDGYLDASNLGGGNSLIVADQGLMDLAAADADVMETLPRAWLLVDQAQQPVSLIVGPALWVGSDAEGDDAPPSVPLEIARGNVRFLADAVHASGATIYAANKLMSLCGIIDSAEHLKKIQRDTAHTLNNLLMADRLGETVSAG